jgi:intracellular sulfur oxidation DsrE/DsrF family protein
MRTLSRSPLVLTVVMATTLAVPPALAAESQEAIRIDVPVALKQANVVFNMDHAAFNGDKSVGLVQMQRMVDHFKKNGTKGKITAVFHGEIAYIGLTDSAYDKHRPTKGGNPYKDAIKRLADEGVEFDFCANTMAAKFWANSDLLPQFKVTTGAIFRITELLEQHYTELQP